FFSSRRRHTRSYGDWSSDVCSSDLWLRAWVENFAPGATLRTFMARAGKEICAAVPLIETRERSADTCFVPMTTWHTPSNDHSQQIGRASCRERVQISGVGGSLKKKS